MNIRLLIIDDWQSWKSLRLEAVKNELTAFIPYHAEESVRLEQGFNDTMTRNNLFGGFIDDQLIGFIGYYAQALQKLKHKGAVWGTYVKPEFRGRGVSSALLAATITHAKSCVRQLHLTCVTTNQSARKLYEKHGFEIYGTEERSLLIGDVFYDEYLMILKFD